MTKSISILTNSFAPDYERFVRLHKSVCQYTDPDVIHYVIVPAKDYTKFQAIDSDRLQVWREQDVLPSYIKPTDRLASLMRRVSVIPSTFRCSAVNLRRPIPPLRGWVLQQILKLAAVRGMKTDAVLVIDSDVELVRKVKREVFFRGETIRLYDAPGIIDRTQKRHTQWVVTAHQLLGLPTPDEVQFPDNIAGVVSWDPNIVRECLARVEDVTGKGWATSFGSKLHISEFILYGTYVRHFGTELQRAYMAPTTLCHSHWDPEAMNFESIQEFVERFGKDDLAVHVQSNSQTSIQIVDRIVSELSMQANQDGGL